MNLPPPPVSAGLAMALNQALKHQPLARERLARHAGKRLRLALPALMLNLALDDAGAFAVAADDEATDLTLTPEPARLPQALLEGDANRLFRAEGDGLLAADLAQAVAGFDWVLALRPYLGDIAAARAEQWLRGASAWRTQAREAIGRNLAEYAVHEAGLLAEPHAARDFIGAVDALREDADRLEVRLALLENARESLHETPPAIA